MDRYGNDNRGSWATGRVGAELVCIVIGTVSLTAACCPTK
jgi:hypothetical protein